MALKANITQNDSWGIPREFPNAYIKIARISGDKSRIDAVVETYTEKDGVLINSESYMFDYDLESADNAITQAYNHIKSLGRYPDAVGI